MTYNVFMVSRRKYYVIAGPHFIHKIAPVPVKLSWRIWVNLSYESHEANDIYLQ